MSLRLGLGDVTSCGVGVWFPHMIRANREATPLSTHAMRNNSPVQLSYLVAALEYITAAQRKDSCVSYC